MGGGERKNTLSKESVLIKSFYLGKTGNKKSNLRSSSEGRFSCKKKLYAENFTINW